MLEPATNSPAPLPDYAPPPGVFGTKVPSSVTFAIAIILFVMPFLEIKCNSITIQSVTGLQMATGFKLKSDLNDVYSDRFPASDERTDKKVERESPNTYALIALVLGIAGLVLSLMNLKAGGIGGLITGVASAASLIGLLVDVSAKIKLKIPNNSGDVHISVGFSPAFYIAIITFLAAAFFSYKRMKANYK